MRSINSKSVFAKTINDLDSHLPKGRSDCFDYGSWYGCDGECPQLQRGECDGDIPVILERLEEDEVDDLYDNGYYIEAINELRSSSK